LNPNPDFVYICVNSKLFIVKIKFCGAAGTVTGSKHLITTESGLNILLDCGLFQGMGSETDPLNRNFGFDPLVVDHLILSHAHIDHSGLIPRLVREGFKGTIHCTPATYDLCELMLRDSASIQESDIEYINRRRKNRGQTLLKPLYDSDDAEKSFPFFKTLPYGDWRDLGGGVSFCFTDAGHVLGSACVSLRFHEDGVKSLFFTADIGRPGDQILRSPQAFPQPDYIICESTYGNRLHEPIKGSEARLLEIVLQTCVKRSGKLIIPAFSLDRTQELIYALDRLEHLGHLPPVKVYIDSPLSVHTTRVIQKHIDCYNDTIRDYMLEGDHNPFFFRNLHFITDVEQSKKLNQSKEPCIIISASGMAEAGRVKHHIKNAIGDSDNTILLVGYCTPSSLGGRLASGQKIVRIFGDEHHVRAQVVTMESYSAHADYSEILDFLGQADLHKVKKVFLVHGEPPGFENLRRLLGDKGVKSVVVPELGESFEI
jgi:metallo-beta-lactamase family protein